MALQERWRGLQQTVVATRCDASRDALADRAVAWLDAMTTSERLRGCGFQSSNLHWLPT
jgi:hypothetical protein